MKTEKIFFITLLLVILYSCSGTSSSTSNSENLKSYRSADEELRAIMEEEGWTLVSNSTNVYRKDLEEIINNERYYKTTYWYTAAVYCKRIGDETKYIIARVVYDDDIAQRKSNGELFYKTFSIVKCNYTDKYGTTYNGYISDGGSTAYLNY